MREEFGFHVSPPAILPKRVVLTFAGYASCSSSTASISFTLKDGYAQRKDPSSGLTASVTSRLKRSRPTSPRRDGVVRYPALTSLLLCLAPCRSTKRRISLSSGSMTRSFLAEGKRDADRSEACSKFASISTLPSASPHTACSDVGGNSTSCSSTPSSSAMVMERLAWLKHWS